MCHDLGQETDRVADVWTVATYVDDISNEFSCVKLQHRRLQVL